MNRDPAGNEEPHQLVLTHQGGTERALYRYDRHVLVAWSPDSHRIAVTDYEGSSDAKCFVFDVRDLSSVDVTKRAADASGRVARIMRNPHAYFECLRWTSNGDLRIRVAGYGNADAGELVTSYRLAPDECTLSMSRQADRGTEALTDWSDVYGWYQRWARCDDGGVAEGVSEAVSLLLANHWKGTARLAVLARKDPAFADFVVRHVDETVPDDRLKRIAGHARAACPKGQRALCNRIERATQ